MSNVRIVSIGIDTPFSPLSILFSFQIFFLFVLKIHIRNSIYCFLDITKLFLEQQRLYVQQHAPMGHAELGDNSLWVHHCERHLEHNVLLSIVD